MFIPTHVYVDSSKSEEAERRLVEAERMHSSQMSVLQQNLQEEIEKRFILCI